jgi:hypothetical protein
MLSYAYIADFGLSPRNGPAQKVFEQNPLQFVVSLVQLGEVKAILSCSSPLLRMYPFYVVVTHTYEAL